MIIYAVTIRRAIAAKNVIDQFVDQKESLGMVFFEDKRDAEDFEARCVDVGLDAFVYPRWVQPKRGNKEKS